MYLYNLDALIHEVGCLVDGGQALSHTPAAGGSGSRDR